jgi:hypothetical protein
MITRKEFLNFVQSLAQSAHDLDVLEYIEHQNDLEQEKRAEFLKEKKKLDDAVFNFFKKRKNKGYVLKDVAYEVTKELKPFIPFNSQDIFASVNRINEYITEFRINRVYNFRQGRVFYYVSDVEENKIKIVIP